MTIERIPQPELISRLANALDGMYGARVQGHAELEETFLAQMVPLLVQALTSGDDDLLELSVYCFSLLEESACSRVMQQALSKASDEPWIVGSIEKVAQLSGTHLTK